MKTLKSTLGLLVLGVILAAPAVNACGRGSITFINNEYKQILIAISENVPENPAIIDRLKEVFTEASAFLYEATNARAVFRDITILVPKSWQHQPDWEPVSHEQIDKSDILVDLPDPAQVEPHRPFVIKTTPCGQLGYYMHLTPTYLLDANVAGQYGRYDRVIVHEWSHLRYGVYDEYPDENSNDHFYATSGGQMEATRCTLALTGRVRDGKTGGNACSGTSAGTVDPDCRFEDDPTPSQPGEQYGSLMYRTHLDHIGAFCDNDVNATFTFHNSEAPTQQNKMCGSRSVWEVMRAHPDFAGDNNPPDDLATEPVFRVVQDTTNRYALILDVSGSMKDNNRIGILNQGVNNFVMSNIQDGEKVGMVTFNTKGKTILPMTVVDDQSRPGIVAKIPTTANGGTSIGAGVRQAITMLKSDEGTAGATCIVVSDGEENTNPRVKDVLQEVIDSGMTCHTIGVTNAADLSMEDLADVTGGLSFLYSEASGNSNGINDAFAEIAQLSTSAFETKYPLTSEAYTLSKSEMLNETVVIDATLGRDTEFTVDYSNSIEITMESPSGSVYDQQSSSCETQTAAKIVKCSFPGLNETGRWSYSVKNTYNGNQRVAVGVVSKASKEGEYPLVANAFWAFSDIDVSKNPPETQSIYASVSKGHVAVLNANVVAEVETPGGSIISMSLSDTGAGADLNKDDGVYSAYYLNFDGDKRYNVKVKVDNTEATMISPTQVVGSSAAPRSHSPYADQSSANIPTGNFQRLATGGSFTLSGYANRKKYLPGQIFDFRVAAVEAEKRQARVEWTAPGSQLDTGTVSLYEIRYSSVFSAVRDGINYTLVNDTMLVAQEGSNSSLTLADPLMAGNLESFLIQFPEDPVNGEHVTYYLGVRARDTDGRDVYGELSNIISISTIPLPLPSESNDALIIGLVVGIIVYITVVAIILMVALLCRPCGTHELMLSTLDDTAGDSNSAPPEGKARKHWEVKETAYYRSGEKPMVVTELKEAPVYDNEGYSEKL